jgi:hypothetical protein
MARIPTPTRGQPIDVSYIYQIVEAINELSTQASSSTYKYAAIDTSSGTQSSLVTETRITAGEVAVYPTLTSITAKTSKNFSYSFKGEYKYAPIVTATPVLIEGTSAGQDISVVITSITTSRVDGVVTFNTGGNIAAKVDLIAIGVPI